jgi:hypothetical protein
MGRGLSSLQRYIVAKAATVERLYYFEILQDYYGWRNHGRPERRYNPITQKFTHEQYYPPGTQKFWPDEIGREQYHKILVTLSRTIARLQQRGLVTWLSGGRSHWSGVEITPEGRRVAAALQPEAG